MTLLTHKIPGIRKYTDLFVAFMREGRVESDGVEISVEGSTSPTVSYDGHAVSVNWPSLVEVRSGDVSFPIPGLHSTMPELLTLFRDGELTLAERGWLDFGIRIKGDRSPTIEWSDDHVKVRWEHGIAEAIVPGPNPQIDEIRVFADHADVVLRRYPDLRVEFE